MNVRSAAKEHGIGWAAIAAIVLWVGFAHADTIDNLIAQLTDASDRVRTSAVLALTNQQSPRAISGLVNTLQNVNESRNIRGLAASALGRIVENGKPTAAQRKVAVDTQTIAQGDPEPFVSAKAAAALAQLGSGGPSTPGPRPVGGVYVNLGPMASATNTVDDPKFRTLMQETAAATMSRVAGTMQTSWPGGIPTKAALDAKGIVGFYVDGTLSAVSVTKSGDSATVSCKVHMVLASYPDRSLFGLLNGGATVQGRGSPTEVVLAQRDCVAAVVEDLIAKKIVPTINSRRFALGRSKVSP